MMSEKKEQLLKKTEYKPLINIFHKCSQKCSISVYNNPE